MGVSVCCGITALIFFDNPTFLQLRGSTRCHLDSLKYLNKALRATPWYDLSPQASFTWRIFWLKRLRMRNCYFLYISSKFFLLRQLNKTNWHFQHFSRKSFCKVHKFISNMYFKKSAKFCRQPLCQLFLSTWYMLPFFWPVTVISSLFFQLLLIVGSPSFSFLLLGS